LTSYALIGTARTLMIPSPEEPKVILTRTRERPASFAGCGLWKEQTAPPD
jgi:hypothetical protein